MAHRKPFTMIAAILFALMAAVHLYRVLVPFEVSFGGQPVPYGASLAAAVLLALLATMLVRESRR